jgi:hypothetical protein
MKKIVSLLLTSPLALVFAGIVCAQPAPAIEWQKCLGGTRSDGAESIIQTSDGGFAIAGQTQSADGDVSGKHGAATFNDAWVVKLGSNGTIGWQKCLGGSNDDYAHSIIQTSDGGFAMAGDTHSFDGDVSGNHGIDDAWVVKLSSAGAIQWQKCLGGQDHDGAYSIIQTSDGGFAVAGWTYSTDGDVSGNHGDVDAWVVKLSSSGAVQWQKCLGGTNIDLANTIIQTSDGGFVMAGFTFSNDGDVSGIHGPGLADIWVVKLNSSGAVQWQKCLGGSYNDIAHSIIQTSDGGLAVVGETLSTDGDVSGNHGSWDVWAVKLSSTGAVQWQKCLGGTDRDEGKSIIQTSDGGFAVTGMTFSPDGDVSGIHGPGFDSADLWVVKLNSSGAIQWQKCLGGTDGDWAESIIQTSDGGFAAAGLADSPDGDVIGNHGGSGSDAWVVKLASPTAATDQLSGIVNTYTQVVDIDSCENTVIVNSTSGISVGDEVLLIQMQGASIDHSNTTSFGAVTNYGPSGSFEFLHIASISGLRVTLSEKIANRYDPASFVQLVKVKVTPSDALTSGKVIAKPWDGTTGGIIALDVSGALTLQNDIDASGAGYRGGGVSSNDAANPSSQGYFYSAASGEGGFKGESVALYSNGFEAGRGANASGGGGGNETNAGGGGGANGGAGGNGGDQVSIISTLPIGGIGARGINPTASHIFMGGGGGGGQQNDSLGTPGGAGGGIVIIRASSIAPAGGAIRAAGASAQKGGYDGSGGGGAGGSVLFDVGNVGSALTVDIKGGAGGDNDAAGRPDCYAPGGGGGGGLFMYTGAAVPASINIAMTGGKSGLVKNPSSTCNNTSYNATDGGGGNSITSFSFVSGGPNFVRPAASSHSEHLCEGDTVGLNASGGASYLWTPAAGLNSASTANPLAYPSQTTNYLVTITDGRGCTFLDSVLVKVSKAAPAKIEGPSIVCENTHTSYYFINPPGTSLKWTVTGSTDTLTIGDTVRVGWGAAGAGKIELEVTVDSSGCKSRDSMSVTVTSFVKPNVAGMKPICEGDTITLTADAGYASYLWSNGDITQSTRVWAAGKYFVVVSVAAGCKGSSDTLSLIVNPLPVPTITASTILLPDVGGSATLTCDQTFATYLWNTGDATQAITVTDSGTYVLTVIDANGCSATTSIHIYRDFGDPVITIKLDTLTAIPGVHVTYLPHIITSQNMPQNLSTDYEMTLSFNTSMLAPITATTSSIINGYTRTITVAGTKDVSQTTGDLAGIEFIAALGDSVETAIHLDTVVWKGGLKPVTVTMFDGAFLTDGLCKQGGTRLFSADGRILLTQNRPNPANGITSIEYETIEEGPVKLWVSDPLGRNVETLVDSYLKPGHYSLSFNVSMLPQGTYFYLLQTPSLLLRRCLIIER